MKIPSVGNLGENTSQRSIDYLSPPAAVSMADQWFDIADVGHFWVRRRFEVLQRLAGKWISGAQQIAEIGCGHGLLQRQIEDSYEKEVTGFDLNEYALKRNVSRRSLLYCYDISQMDAGMKERFDVIFLFDVLEHITDEDAFLKALLFHLKPGGKLIVNVPAGQWAYSAYDKAVGHVRRYLIGSLQEAARRNRLETITWTYWGLPLVPTLLLRKLWLMGWKDQDKIVSVGLDSRTPGINKALGILSRCEPIPQKLLGTSLMAVLAVRTPAPNTFDSRQAR